MLSTEPGAGQSAWLDFAASPGLAAAPFVLLLANGTGLISRLLSTSAFVLLGEMSYSTYLLHHILLRFYLMHSAELAAVLSWICFSVFITALLLLSHAVWATIEHQVRERVKRQWLHRELFRNRVCPTLFVLVNANPASRSADPLQHFYGGARGYDAAIAVHSARYRVPFELSDLPFGAKCA
jgi:peptidoglycan/LPS O-acetylase OafA/YrhL